MTLSEVRRRTFLGLLVILLSVSLAHDSETRPPESAVPVQMLGGGPGITFDAEDADPGIESDTPESSGPTIVHKGSRRLPRSAFKAELPLLIERFVTDRGSIEPSLSFTEDGSLMFASVDTSADPSAGEKEAVLYRSDDFGRTWEENIPVLPGGAQFHYEGIDPYLWRDPLTGRIYYVLYSLPACTSIAWTDDGGDSWDFSVPLKVCDQAGVTDYPKLWTSRPTDGDTTIAGAPFYVHLCYNRGLGMGCQRSVDGGRTFLPSVSPYPDMGSGECEVPSPLPGWAIASSEDGTIYMPKAYCGKLELAISSDNGGTWERVVVAEDTQEPGTGFGSEVRVAQDSAGNLYYFWLSGGGDIVGGEQPSLKVSTDGGESWGPTIDVGVPSLTAAKYPSIVAGDDGRVAFSYLGTGVGGGFEASKRDMRKARWNAYVGFSIDATAKDSVIATAMVNPKKDPLHRGKCDFRCSPDPDDCGTFGCDMASPVAGIYDYLHLALDPKSGRVALSMVDLCAGKCSGSQAEHRWDGWWFGAVGIQVRGPRLR